MRAADAQRYVAKFTLNKRSAFHIPTATLGMKTTITALLVIGVTVNLLKASDLVLRPHQAKWTQAKFESLTLQLDYTKPITWFRYLSSDKGQRILRVIAGVPIFLVVGVSLTPIGGCCSWIFTFFFITVVFRSNRLNTRWFSIPVDYPSFLKRYAFLSLIQLAAALILIAAYRLFNHLSLLGGTQNLAVALLGLSVVITLIVLALFDSVWLTVWLANTIALLFSGVFLLLEGFLKLMRGIAWRIVEYNKGVLAAIVLIATVTLALVDYYLRMKG